MKKPNHVAIIMDGNGRWGIKHYNSRLVGHNYGSQNIKKIIKASLDIGLKNLTLYSLSSDNLNKRPKKEINNIFFYLNKILKKVLIILKKKKLI